MLIASAILFCCAMAPATPSIIVLTQGDQYQYFIALTIFYIIAGGLNVALFSDLTEELAAREYLSGQPSMLGQVSNATLDNERHSLQPCGCQPNQTASDKDDDF